MSVRAYMGLGSNQGDRYKNLLTALSCVHASDRVSLLRVSPIYCTAPVGITEQPDFYNAVAALDTERKARHLLQLFLQIETRMGRVRTMRWGPRLIDLDLLLYGDKIIREDGLCVPHPELMRRRFVLQPLKDVGPDLTVPEPEKPLNTGCAG
ncbi:MAG: 2-amino-4-hydroxy-6-hydroxymethyldihydropteridine diphosphokinase [candidate division KSB1 bacterium]|nr:2-amino-4-hydroxy-6-hydroxymethyldihydropteridine diphosphokinase [candidate division KSB1 bacterium]